MRTLPAVLFVIGWLIPVPATSNSYEQTPKADASQGREAKKSEPTSPSIVQNAVLNCKPSEHNANAGAASTTKQPHGYLEWANAISTVVIAVFAIVTAIAVVKQVSTARKTDRAWLIVSPVEHAPVLGFIPEPGDALNEPGREQQNVFLSSIKNTGRTPAKLVASTLRYCKVDSLKDIPEKPQYREMLPYEDLLLVVGDSTGELATLYPNVFLENAEIAAIKTRKAFLYAFGKVIYRDVYGNLRETRFGYVYHFPAAGDQRKPGFIREGMPRAYNKAS